MVVLVDRHQLEQVVLNVAINARHAMPDGGTLSVTTEPASAATGDAQVTLRVRDTGHGMTAEVRDRVFEPFFTTKAPGEGTGLGLASVYGIVHQSGGDVSIESSVGAGTTVSVTLPCVDVAPTELVVGDSPRRGDERILLVEDEQALRVTTGRILSEAGYDVVVASDGAEALSVFEHDTKPFDLVLTDVAMPRMRGDELARRLCERRPGIKIVTMSGYDGGDAPALRRLAKPVTADALLRTIREVLDD
jgi:CheY-like chemotaxis protein